MRTSPPAARDTRPAPSDVPVPAPPRSGAGRGRRSCCRRLTVAGLFTLLFLRNHRFAYLDDRQADGVAKLVDMGRILRSGEWPWLSTDVVNSGGYAVEYQNGVFNPVNLAFGVLMGNLDDAASPRSCSCWHTWCCSPPRRPGSAGSSGSSTAWAVAFAVSVGFQPYTVFWGAAWYQAIVSFSWFVLAVAAAVALHLTGRQRHGWLLLVATYPVPPERLAARHPRAGPVRRRPRRRPPGDGHAARRHRVDRRLVRRRRRRLAGRALPAGRVVRVRVAQLLDQQRQQLQRRAARGAGARRRPGLLGLVHQLRRLPAAGPAALLRGLVPAAGPGLLAAGRSGRRPPVRALGLATVGLLLVTALGALGPERFLVFRFPTRFLQYSGFFLLLAVALLVAHGTLHRSHVGGRHVLGGLLVVQTGNALQADPDSPGRIVGLGVLVGVLCLALVVPRAAAPAAGRWRPLARLASHRGSDAVVAVGTVVMLAVVALPAPDGPRRRLGFPARPDDGRAAEPATTTRSGSATTRRSCSPDELPSPADDVADFYAEYHPSSMGLLVGERQVNGYSPLAHRFLREHLPIDDHGNFGDTGAERFTAVDPETGLTWLELLRVDQVVALLGPRDASLQQSLDDSWRRVAEGRHTADLPPRPVRPAGPACPTPRPGPSRSTAQEACRLQPLAGVRRRHRLRRRARPGGVRPAVVPGLLRHARRRADRRRAARRHAGRRGPASRVPTGSWSSPTDRRGSFRWQPSRSPWSSGSRSPRWSDVAGGPGLAREQASVDAAGGTDDGEPGTS